MMYNKPHQDYAQAKALHFLSADSLYDYFSKKPEKAEALYVDRIIEVNGTVEEINLQNEGNPSLILSAEGAMMGGINAHMNSSYKDDADLRDRIAQLQEGDQVTLKCRCLGYEQDLMAEVILDKCFLK